MKQQYLTKHNRRHETYGIVLLQFFTDLQTISTSALRHPTGKASKDLIVLLRGMGGSHASFEKERLINQLEVFHLNYELAAPNLNFGNYSGESLNERFKTSIIEPAKARGIENIWLVDVSMGGLGYLIYLSEYPEDINGVYLLSRYLGYDNVEKEIT